MLFNLGSNILKLSHNPLPPRVQNQPTRKQLYIIKPKKFQNTQLYQTNIEQIHIKITKPAHCYSYFQRLSLSTWLPEKNIF